MGPAAAPHIPRTARARQGTPRIPNTEPLRAFFQTLARPYLEGGGAAESRLTTPEAADARFAELRARVDPAALAAEAILQGLCGQRRGFDRQAWLHRALHVWLLVHLPLSIALIVLMLIHIPAAFWHR